MNWCSPNFGGNARIEELKGKVITDISGMENGSEEIYFTCSDGSKYLMYHEQDCCECVRLEDVAGNPEDLIGTELLICEETMTGQDSDLWSQTFTYYKFATLKGYVTLRWLGESNGYYSESVDFCKIKED